MIHSEVAQLCPTLCDPVDCRPPVSSVHGILQARTLEWVAISFSNMIHDTLEKAKLWTAKRLVLARSWREGSMKIHSTEDF